MNFRPWIEAARPKTLAAAVIPVAVGASVALHHELFDVTITLITMLCAVLLQVGTNFANDYYDYKKGADREDRIGFPRATASGAIRPETIRRATYLTFAVAFLIGLYLVAHGGWVILAIGIASILAGLAYTGGPFPLGYNGLGDVFVFLFFGIIAVMGTFYLNTLSWSLHSFLAAIPVGALSTNILVVNNLRDIESDRKAGKKTLGVLFGEHFLKKEYLLLLALAFAMPPHLYFREDMNGFIFLPMITLPFGLFLAATIYREQSKQRLNKALERTAQFLTQFGLLLALGFVLG